MSIFGPGSGGGGVGATVSTDLTDSATLARLATDPQVFAGVNSFKAIKATGTAGAGYLELPEQSATPATPTNAARFFVDASNRFSWIGENGFVRTIDGTGITASRVWALPDLAGTVALTTNNLSVFAATTSAQLRGVLSDPTGTGPSVFADSPAFTTKALFPDGSSAAPGIAFSAEPGTGIYRSSTRVINLVAANQPLLTADIQNNRVTIGSGTQFGWTSTSSTSIGTPDTLFTRFAAANIQLGAAASATPVAQTFSVQDGAGTDIAGATWTLRASRGTGAGAPGRILLAASAAALGSSATLQTAVTHLDIGAGYVKLGSGVNLRQSNDTVRITDGGVFRSSDNTAGISGTFTVAGLISFTVKDGIITATA